MNKAVIEKIPQVDFAGVVADELTLVINDAIEEKGSCSMVLAGGKTPASIYRSLSVSPRRDEIDWSKLKIFVDDERFVPFDSDQNNYKMIYETLISKLPVKPEVVKIETEGVTIQESSDLYRDNIKKSLNLKDNELPEFDIVLLGISKQGSTASIFPGKTLPEKNKDICYVVDDKKWSETQRVTLSSHVLFGAKKIFFITNGEEKAEVVAQVLQEDHTPEEMPVMLYKNVEDRVTFFLGGASIKELKNF